MSGSRPRGGRMTRADDTAAPRFYRLGRVLARYHWLVIACWAAFFVAGTLLLPRFRDALTGPPLGVRGSESERAGQILDERFAHPFSEQDLIVFASDRLTVHDPAYQRVVTEAVRAVGAVSHVAGVIGPLDPRASHQISSDGHIAAAIVGVSGSGRTRQAVSPKLERAAQAAATDDVRVYLTGRSPLVTDLIHKESQDLIQAERLGLPAALVVLLIAFGSPIAAGLPILLALAGVTVTFGILGAATALTSFDLFVENITTMVGLGVGIDYSLFIVTRYREELARGTPPTDAVGTAVATAGKTIFFSGLTVLISLAGLLLVDARIFTELAIGAMVSVGVMVAGALTLLPAGLGLLGRRVNALTLPFLRGAVAHPDPDSGFWARWARGVMHHPQLWAVAVALVLLVITAPVTRIKLGLSTGANTQGTPSSAVGRAIVDQGISGGLVSPIQIVVASRAGPLDDHDLDAVARLTGALAADHDVSRVVSVTQVLDQVAGNHAAATLAAAAANPRAAAALSPLVNVARGRDTTVLTAIPAVEPDSEAALDLVRRIRDDIVPGATDGTDLTVDVGGLTAQIADISAESSRKLPYVSGLVFALTFLLLAMVFRSLILPLKAITMNLLSLGAAYGLLVVVFQEGRGERVFGFTSPGNIQVYLPLLIFAILFGLSMDYEVFLIGRMKEEWERTGRNEIAVARGLQHTARVIASAAAIMVAVFASFAFTRVLEIQELGFSLAVAVLVDATLVRLLLVPALMRLLGRWNWWFPPALDRILPKIELAEGPARPKPAGAIVNDAATPGA